MHNCSVLPCISLTPVPIWQESRRYWAGTVGSVVFFWRLLHWGHKGMFPHNLPMIACSGMMVLGLWVFIVTDWVELIKKLGNRGGGEGQQKHCVQPKKVLPSYRVSLSIADVVNQLTDNILCNSFDLSVHYYLSFNPKRGLSPFFSVL